MTRFRGPARSLNALVLREAKARLDAHHEPLTIASGTGHRISFVVNTPALTPSSSQSCSGVRR